MKYIILSLGTYVNTDQNRTINAFENLGVSKLEMFYQWFNLPVFLGGKILNKYRGPSLTTLFNEFNLGLLTPDVFKGYLKDKFPVLNTKTDKEIDDAWNVMCRVTNYTSEAFVEASRLHNGKDTIVILHSNTNPLHHKEIERQYQQEIPGEKVFSYQSRYTGIQLLKNYIESIKSKGDVSPGDILFVYTPPPAMPYPKLGLLNWILAPFASWAASNGQNYVNQLQKLSQNNFTLVPTQATRTHPNILETVKDFMPKPESKKERVIESGLDLSVTPRYTPTLDGDEPKNNFIENKPEIRKRRSKSLNSL